MPRIISHGGKVAAWPKGRKNGMEGLSEESERVVITGQWPHNFLDLRMSRCFYSTLPQGAKNAIYWAYLKPIWEAKLIETNLANRQSNSSMKPYLPVLFKYALLLLIIAGLIYANHDPEIGMYESIPRAATLIFTLAVLGFPKDIFKVYKVERFKSKQRQKLAVDT